MPTQDTFDIGDAPILTVEFANAAGAPTSPTVVTFYLLAPDGSIVTYAPGSPQITNPSTGVYVFAFPVLAVEGLHKWRVTGTGAVTAATEGVVSVRASAFV